MPGKADEGRGHEGPCHHHDGPDGENLWNKGQRGFVELGHGLYEGDQKTNAECGQQGRGAQFESNNERLLQNGAQIDGLRGQIVIFITS